MRPSSPSAAGVSLPAPLALLSLSGLLPFLGLACGGSELGPCPPGSHREADGLCYLDEDTGAAIEDGGAGDGGSDSSPPDLDFGDPVTTLGSTTDGLFEHVDAEIIDENWAILVGQGGYSIASLADGSIDGQYGMDRGYYIGLSGDTAWVGTKYSGLYEVDLSDPTAPVTGRRLGPTGDSAHQDVDFDGSIIAVSWLDEGVQLVDHETLVELGRVPASEARGLALGEARLFFCDEVDDQAQLVMVDISDPSAPVELDRVDLSSRGHDVSVQGDRVAVALGGSGAAVFRVQDQVLSHRGDVQLPGTTMGVALDGDYLWTGSWEVVGLVWVGDGATPTVLGHEEVTESAMGIGAGAGKAMVADWFYATALQVEEGVGGPELVVDDSLYIDGDAGSGERYRLELWNNGLFDLDLGFEVGSGNFSVDTESLTLAPGVRDAIIVEQTGGDPNGSLVITSNDPDEQTSTVLIQNSATGVGQAHMDFNLQGFNWPDGSVANYRLTDFEGEVLFLAYWAEY